MMFATKRQAQLAAAARNRAGGAVIWYAYNYGGFWALDYRYR